MTPRPVAFVTGASRGIGRGIALALAEAGFDIVGGATSYDPNNTQQGLGETRQCVEAFGVDFEPAPGDIADLNVHEQLMTVALKRFGRIDVLVNNAGVAPHERRDILETSPESFDRVMGINARGPFFLTQRVARQMLAQTWTQPPAGSIIFVSSISATVSSPTRAEYCLSKAALSHAATIFADRLAGSAIAVHEVRPGIVATDMTAKVRDEYDARIADGLVPQQRWGRPEDIGKAVAALARGDFGYATGLVIELSGGMNIRRL